MIRRRVRALVLAAGRGERLQPLSSWVPKPLLPVGGRSVLAHTLAQLAALGCEACAVNLHHMGDAIRSRLGSSFGGMPLTYSPEERLLGTLGALSPLREFLGDSDLVLLINGDTLCRWPLKRLIRRHLGWRASATLVLTDQADPAEYGALGIDRSGRIRELPGSSARHDTVRREVFAGAHCLSPELLQRVGSEPADIIRDLYRQLLEEGQPLYGLVSSRPWYDLGTPGRYLRGALDWVRGRWPLRAWRRSWVSPEAVMETGSEVRRSVLEGDARVEGKARVQESVLLPGARVGRHSVVRQAVVGFATVLPPHSRVEGRMVTAARAGDTPPPGGSVVSGLIYSRLEGPGLEAALGADGS